MKLDQALPLLSLIKGCTIASLDAVTFPSVGIRKVTTGQRVMLFTNQETSGYENMVKRRLAEEGKNPDNFVIGDLPWGARMPGTPLFVHKDKKGEVNYYLQTIELSPGRKKYFIGNTEVDPAELGFKGKEFATNQGLSPGNEVVVSTYNIVHITKLVCLGQEIVDVSPERARLGLKLSD